MRPKMDGTKANKSVKLTVEHGVPQKVERGTVMYVLGVVTSMTTSSSTTPRQQSALGAHQKPGREPGMRSNLNPNLVREVNGHGTYTVITLRVRHVPWVDTAR